MTLSEASKIVRKGVVLTGIFAVVYYIFLLLLFPGAKKLFIVMFPEKDPPTPVYGVLPPLEFIEKDINDDRTPSFILDTKDGRLPKGLPRKMTVYEYIRSVPPFEKGKNASATAEKLGYYEDDLITSLKETTYRWRKLNSNGLLEINTNTKDVIHLTPLTGKASRFPRGELTETKTLNYAKELLEDVGRFEDELYLNGTQKVTFVQFYGNRLETTEAPLDAQLARVDFFRSIEEYPILGPDPKVGLQYIYLRRPTKNEPHYNYPILESHVREIKTQANATYPIITVADAWNLVKNSKGVIVNATPSGSNLLDKSVTPIVEDIYINNIYLAYYDNSSYQEYLQPIYIFEGKYTTGGTQGGTITIYYPALTPDFIQSVN